ncbi:tRNA nucleotidyltransferase (CCA-adding enzyme) [Caloranaerobacter azorensis DSM 13643]|uniref:tRNA nucleotidyltransferase (CCA-adding enzyme) n=1 Tax=Caloranaerobacter azorensis DSM 13643 TaxID=1121264 RepID=A0A1M5TBF3_9FIRM|nr:CCA tRNA nucleotidyltransferase [Caloranaerobacter azorensis]SHH48135.1 tRNA nucleotidyltransferase (CCA-adding enzyme) [Caloranaerobacter azorensis DSM 13643]
MKLEVYRRELKQYTINTEIKNILFIASEIAKKYNKEVYLVGGQVRDIMLGNESSDVDFVAVENAMDFLEKLYERIGGEKRYYKNFLSGSIELKNGINIDVTTARKEIYENPGALPIVFKGSLSEDVKRRDFTINCLLVDIKKLPDLEILDFVGGIRDLNNKKIRILHEKSFIDDPTRMIRAVRFAYKLGFEIEEDTKKLLFDSVEKGYIRFVSEDRIFREIVKIFLSNKKYIGIRILYEYRLFQNTFLSDYIDEKIIEYFRIIDDELPLICELYNITIESMQVINLLVLFHNIGSNYLLGLFDKLNIPKKIRKIIVSIKNNYKYVNNLINKDKISTVTIYKIIDLVNIEGLIYFAITNFDNNIFIKKLIEYSEIYNNMKLFVSGENIKKYDLKPGPIYKRIKDELIFNIIAKKAYTEKEQLEILNDIIKKNKRWYNDGDN